MKILHVIETGGSGGAESIFLRLADGLREHSLLPVAVVAREGWLSEQLRSAQIAVDICRPGHPTRAQYLFRIAKIARKHHCSVIVAHLFGAITYCSIVGLISGIPIVGVLHGQTDLGIGKPIGLLRGALVRLGSDRIICVSDALKAFVVSQLPFARGRVQVISNGIDIESFAQSSSADYRSLLGIASDALVLSAVGNLKPAKGYPTMLDAIGILTRKGMSVHLIVAGRAMEPLLSELVDQARSLGIESRIHFLGHVSDVRSVLRSSDLLLSTSVTEGFSLAIVEAHATGLPVVATRSGGPESVVIDGQNGFLVDVGDARAVADRVEVLCRDPALRRSFGAVGQMHARRNYSVQSMIERYSSVIREVAPKRFTSATDA